VRHQGLGSGRGALVAVATAVVVAATAVATGTAATTTRSLAVSTATGLARAVGPLPAGWAAGGTAANPQSQVDADSTCASNSVLLFSARGSGDVYGGDIARNKVGAWTQGAGIELIHEGWDVRDLQAIYPAPPVPSWKQLVTAIVAGGGLTAKSATAVALIVKQFRDVASNSWQTVEDELNAAYNRCPTRKILLAGYSQGAILLRYIVPRLPLPVRNRIVSVDLFADPTEQAVVDRPLQHPPALDGRLTTMGLDTFSGVVLSGKSFRQRAYPEPRKVYQYCVQNDLVCELNVGNLALSNSANEGKIHASYGFENIGINAGKRVGAFGASALHVWGDDGQAYVQPKKLMLKGWSFTKISWSSWADSANGTATLCQDGKCSTGTLKLEYKRQAYCGDGPGLWAYSLMQFDAPGAHLLREIDWNRC
jgi:hypothetical protein